MRLGHYSLAVDKRHQKQGHGEWLMVDALNKLLYASDIAAFPMIVVDAKDGAAAFYEQFGFIPFRDAPHKLFMPAQSVRKSFK